MAALEMLEILLQPGAAGEEPVGFGIADAAREREVQPKARFVDEVVHIGFVTAIIIAAEKGAAAPVQEHPMGEMDCTDACERSTRENVASHPIDPVKDRDLGPKAKPSRLHRAHGGVLVGYIMILAPAKLCDPVGVVTLFDDLVRLFVPA